MSYNAGIRTIGVGVSAFLMGGMATKALSTPENNTMNIAANAFDRGVQCGKGIEKKKMGGREVIIATEAFDIGLELGKKIGSGQSHEEIS